jgi:altronate dehydratase large subunit
MWMEALLMHSGDDVALAVMDLRTGDVIQAGGRSIVLRQPIPSGHKFALRAIANGDLVRKYGQLIGRATAAIAPGEHVHVHNVESLRGRGDLSPSQHSVVLESAGFPPSAADDSVSVAPAEESFAPTFLGYRRKDGRVGVRNHVLVMSTVGCANAVVDHIGQALPEVVALSHVYGCSQIGDNLAQSRRVLEGFAAHPNVGAVLLIGLGCESMPTVEMGDKLAARGILAHRLTIQDEGGSRATFAKGVSITRELLQETSSAACEPVPLSELIVGVECGGSDAWSGVAANPAVGMASDLLVQAGGTVILSEVTEFIGAEHLLAARAADPSVARQIVEATVRREEEAKRMKVDMRGGQPTPGNIAGGLTTIEEKSLGAIAKGGSTPIREFLDYAYPPTRRGLVIMDTPGNDLESVTAMVAGGAQVVVFTTGRGSPTGCPIAPVIKVASNSAMYHRLQDDMDLNTGTVISAEESLDSVGRRLLSEIVAVASGKQTAAEAWGHKEFAISEIGARL